MEENTMRHLALTLSIIGAILIAAGAVSYFIASSIMTGGMTALFVIGAVAIGLGLICFIAHFVSARRHRHNV